MDVTINSSTNTVQLTNTSANSIAVTQSNVASPTISVQDGTSVSLINATPLTVDILNTRLISGEGSELTISELLAKADLAGTASFGYTNGDLTSISYSDYDGITNNSKTLSYLNGSLDQVQHSFVYSSVTWTITKSFTYTNGVLTGKNTNIQYS